VRRKRAEAEDEDAEEKDDINEEWGMIPAEQKGPVSEGNREGKKGRNHASRIGLVVIQLLTGFGRWWWETGGTAKKAGREEWWSFFFWSAYGVRTPELPLIPGQHQRPDQTISIGRAHGWILVYTSRHPK
jgi:hypothetical protein